MRGDARAHRHRPVDRPATRAPAALEAALAGARRRSTARPCDLVVVFASGAHLAAPEATLEGVHEALAPAALVGCGAGGVLGARREVEERHRRRGVGGAARRRRGERRSTPTVEQSRRAPAR